MTTLYVNVVQGAKGASLGCASTRPAVVVIVNTGVVVVVVVVMTLILLPSGR